MKKLFGNKKILTAIVIAIVAIALPLTLLQVKKQQDLRQRASGTGVVFSFNPASSTQPINQNFNSALNMNTGGDAVRGLDFSLSFNKDILTLVSFTPSSSFGQSIIPVDVATANTTGMIRYAAGTLSSPPNGAAISIGTFVFKGKAQGAAILQFTRFEVIDPTPAVLNASSQGVTYTISGDVNQCKTTPGAAGSSCSSACPNDCQQGLICRNSVCSSTVDIPTPTPLGCILNEQKVCITPTPLPTSVLTPTPTGVTQGGTKIIVGFTLPGIGASTGTKSGYNPTPARPNRQVSIKLLNSTNQQSETIAASASVSSQITTEFTWKTAPTVITSSAGTYSAYIKVDNSLWKRLSGIQTITAGTTNNLGGIKLVTGDMDGNDRLNLADYTKIIGCVPQPPNNQPKDATCTGDKKTLADINDDGKVSDEDIMILLSGFATRDGDLPR